VNTFADRVDAILDEALAPAETARRVAEALGPLLATEGLLDAEHRASGASWYRKHVLYADPEHRFTLLALVWLPGQGTDVHGHTAWGAVGVYEGHPSVVCYDCVETPEGHHVATETRAIRCSPGDTATVRPGLADVHRIHNPTGSTTITLHAYGRDLVEDPDAINLLLRQ